MINNMFIYLLFFLYTQMKKIVILSVGLLSLTVTSFSFASSTWTTCTSTWAICQLNQQFKTEIQTAKTQTKTEIQTAKDEEKANKEMIEMNKKNFNANFSGAKAYLIKPLTITQKEEINTIIKTKDIAMRTLQAETNALVKSGTIDRSGYITKATDILTSFRASILPYVATEKSTRFDTFIQSKIDLMITNIELRQTNQNIKMKIGNKKVTFKTRLEAKKTEKKDLIANIKTSKKKK